MTLMPMNTSQLATVSGIDYQSSVCPSIERANGEVVTMPCSHNVLYNIGKNNTITALTTAATAGPFTNITLINASAGVGVAAAAGNTWVAYTGCNLSSTAGTVTDISMGNVSIAWTFTSTCDGAYLNATRISNKTGGLLAGNTFPISLLNTGDRFTQTWIVWVE